MSLQKELVDIEDPSTGPWNLLKYEKGQYFHSHTDTKESENHLYTALLLPSNSFSRYTGGELFIHDKPSFEESTEKMVISCADLDKDTLVVFPIGFYHEVLPVLEGVRYVFKKPLSVKVEREYFPLFNSSQATVPASEDVMIRLKKQHEARSSPPNFVDSRPHYPMGERPVVEDGGAAVMRRRDAAKTSGLDHSKHDVKDPESADSRPRYPMGERPVVEDGGVAAMRRRDAL